MAVCTCLNTGIRGPEDVEKPGRRNVQSNSGRSPFTRGIVAGIPFLLAAGPMGLVFGLVATEAGLKLYEVMSMSVVVIAGAAQLTALAQMHDAAPVGLVILAGLLVNLRLAIYSASLAPHLGRAPLWKRALAAYVMVDQVYALSSVEFQQRPAAPVGQKLAFFFGTALPMCLGWYLFSFLGAAVGQAIPPSWGLDAAVPIAFVALVAPMTRTLAHLSAVMTSVVVALLLAPLPYNLELMVAALSAMAVGAEVERRTGRSDARVRA